MTTGIMIVGVGGQGTLLASRLIGGAVAAQGLDVKVSEVHGMSQRGGSVVTYVKYGEHVDSPIIGKGEADFILAFEELEAARWLPYLKKGGKIVVNRQNLDPMPVITGAAVYPLGLIEKMQDAGIDVKAEDALALAVKAGSSKAVNVVLIGMFAASGNIPEQVWLDTIKKTVPEKFLDMNLQAFRYGYES
jgi:indolepyruvate ferredoxin oxidoreductase beta subunit